MAGNERTLVKVRCNDGGCGRTVAEVTTTTTRGGMVLIISGPKGKARVEFPVDGPARRPWCREHGIRTTARGSLEAAARRARLAGRPETVTCVGQGPGA